MLLAPDVSLGARYTLRSRIAVGGMGEVWRAADTMLHREVAIKVLKGDLSGDPAFLDRFRAEARHTAALAHPGIASVFDYGEATADGSDQTDTAYLVMELIDGEPLSALLAREGKLSPDQALDVLAQTARALAAAHVAGVIHRDVKPGNILIQPDGTVKITDFGIARVINAAPVTATGMVMGTSYYLSPEQAAGQLVTPVSDVYSLGVVGYEALSGRRPFVGDNPLAVAMMHVREEPAPLPAEVAERARAVISRAMAKDPAARFPTAAAMAEGAMAARGGAMAAREDAVADQGATAALAGSSRIDDPMIATTPIAVVAAATPPTSATPTGRRPRAVVLALAALLSFLLFVVLAHIVTRKAREASFREVTPTASPGARQSAAATRPAATSTGTVDRASYVGTPHEETEAAPWRLGLAVPPTGGDSKTGGRDQEEE